MSHEFWQHTAYDDEFDPDHVLSMVKMAYDHDLLLVLEIDNCVCGFIAGVAIPLLGNGNVTQVTEMGYWINRDKRGQYGEVLIDGLEIAAENIGAVYINMISMESSHPEVAEHIYRKRGYEKIETVYCKRIGKKTWPSRQQL